MGFRDKDGSTGEKKVWEVLDTLAIIPKNKSDVLRITKARYAGKELISFQVWRTNSETGDEYPLKDQKVNVSVDLRDKLIEALENVT